MEHLSNQFLKFKKKIRRLFFNKITVSDLWIDWLHDYKKLKRWTDNRAIERRLALGKKYVFPFIGNKHPKCVTTSDIVKCFEYCANQTTQTQGKVLTALSQFFKWCDSKKYRNTGKRLPTDRELLEPHLGMHLRYHQNSHYPAIDWRDVPRFIAFLIDKYNITTTSSKLLLFSILTVSRSQSVRFAQWGEIDFQQSEWNIPSSHMKGKQGNNLPHNVPLSKQALRWVSEKWTSRNKLGDNYVLGGIHYETSTSTVHCRVQKERCQSCC